MLGLIGLASGDRSRPFTERELEALARFAQARVDRPRQRPPVRAGPDRGPPARARRPPRHAHGAAEPDAPAQPPGRAARPGRVGSRPEPALARGASSCSTSTGSRSSTRASGTRPATCSSPRSRDGSSRPPAARTWSRGSAATSSACCSGPVRSVREAERVAARVTAAVSVPFDLDGQEVIVGASIGLAVGRPAATYAGDLLKEAEIALHRAKVGPGPQVRHVRPRDARRDARPGHARARPPSGHRPLRAPGALPAARRPRERQGRRARGAPALAAPDARARAAAVVHPARRGDRPDPADRPVGARDRVPPGPRLAAPLPVAPRRS